MFNSRLPNTPLQKTEKGYSWRFFTFRRAWVLGCLATLLILGVSISFFIWYNYNGDDLSSSGNVGLSYAIAGFTFLILAAVAYTIRRRLDKPALGQLNRALNWHTFFALIALVLLCMHSFGDFELLSGTYALLGMFALILSGLLGRFLDRFLAWRIALEASIILTAEGEERVETIIQETQTAANSRRQEIDRSALRSSPPRSAPVSATQEKRSWDIAYSSLEKLSPELLPRKQQGGQSRSASRALPSAQKQMAALQEVQQAMRREQFYRSLIHTWRRVHLGLAFLTLGLTVIHVIIEMPFLYRALFH